MRLLGLADSRCLAQVIRRGGRASQALSAETSHLILVPSVGAADCSSSWAEDPSAVLLAVRERAGGVAGLKALRGLLDKRQLAVHDARWGTVRGSRCSLPP